MPVFFEDVEWENAACRGVGVDTFIPSSGEADEADKQEALDLCAKCPIRLDCLQYALDNNEEFGIWGGVPQTERRQMIAELPIPKRMCKGCRETFQPEDRRNRVCSDECSDELKRRAQARTRWPDPQPLKAEIIQEAS